MVLYGILNQLGLYAFLSLIPFIILYLRRPRPLEKVFPSLMFFMEELKSQKSYGWLEKLIRNLLFFLQLLIILLMSIAAAEPYLVLPREESSGQTVLVIDGSASMKAKLPGTSATRFDKAIEEAKNRMEGRITIILATRSPSIELDHGNKAEALTILNALKAKDTTSDIKGGMLLSQTVLGKEKANIYVLSDFIATDENDQPLQAKRMLSSQGNKVTFVEIGTPARNVGMVSLDLNKLTAKVSVKNYNNEKEVVAISHVQDKKTIIQQQLTILPKSIETAEFTIVPGTSTLELTNKDDFDLDDKVFISSPKRLKTKVLLITNAENSPVESALRASDEIELEVREPPIINPDKVDHDVIVVSSIDRSLYVPADFVTLSSYVSKGHALVLVAQEDMSQLRFANLLPVTLEELKSESTGVQLKVVNAYTKDVELGKVSKYWKAGAPNSTQIIAAAQDGNPMLVYAAKDKGKIFYYGFIDAAAEFPTSVSYPVFWNNLVKSLAQSEDINDYNKRTTDIEFVKYGEVGIYEVQNRNVALNLLDEKESAVSADDKLGEADDRFVLEKGEAATNVTITNYIIAAGMLLLLLELLYVKRRGDL
ncbi:BatA domain-containing protein [Candidatus Woesearchaeota archaeon]|nr:BatA domain-containing protein [Candidatus Woesearchaeota archaeon]